MENQDFGIGTSRRSFNAGVAAMAGLMVTGAAYSAPAETTVEIAQGKLSGYRNADIHVFKGIPYGSPVAGAGRFAAATGAGSWSGVRDATQYGPSAPQFLIPMTDAARQPAGIPPLTTLLGWGKDEKKDENCLVLNVWTPGIADGKRRPVMFRIHGGSYMVGSGSWPQSEGTAVARRGDVVVVTVNHRLGALGYLYLAELGGARYADSGNSGMLDLVLALQWVRDNIEWFGGNPDNVTVFGESGGGAKIATLMAMPRAKGLFHRAIIESAPRNATRTPDVATAATRKVLEKLGMGTGDLDKLHTLPAATFLIAEAAGLGPVIDGRIVPVHPDDAVSAGSASSVPLLIGTNRTEMTLFELNDLAKMEAFDKAAMRAHLAPQLGTDTDKIINAYERTFPTASPGDLTLFIEADRFVRVYSVQFAEHKIAGSTAPTFMYLFNWRGNAVNGLLKSSHGLEVPFTMDNVDCATALSASPGSRELAATMSDAWIAFARTGRPHASTMPDWPGYTLDKRATMLLDDRSRVIDNPFGELSAWRDVPIRS